MTLNLGLRWDYFQPVYEHHGNQANFIPDGAPTNGPAYLIPSGPNSGNLSSGCPTCFTDLLAQDGIALVTGKYGKSLAEGQKNNIAPRLGFAYQASPKLVVRGGFGIFYNGFENRGFLNSARTIRSTNFVLQSRFGPLINNFGCAGDPSGRSTMRQVHVHLMTHFW